MGQALAVFAALCLPALVAQTKVAEGTAARFDEGVMPGVVANRLAWGDVTRDQVDRAAGFVALLDCGQLGRFVWLEQGERVDGPYLVTDCVAEAHRPLWKEWERAVDLDWAVALDWDVVDDVGQGFTVWDGPPYQGTQAPGYRRQARSRLR